MKKIIITSGILVSCLLIGIGIFGFIKSKHFSPNNNNINNENNNNSSVLTLDYLKTKLNHIKQATNFSYKVEIETNKEGEDATTDMKWDLNTKESEVVMSINGVLATHNYTVLEDGILVDYITAPFMGMNDWYRSTGDSTSSTEVFKYIDILLANISYFKVEDNVFKGILSKDVVEKLVNTDEDDLESVEAVGDGLAVIRLSDNSNNLDITFDFSNSIKTGEDIYSKFIYSMTYYNLGGTKIIVPEDVKTNAKTMGE